MFLMFQQQIQLNFQQKTGMIPNDEGNVKIEANG